MSVWLREGVCRRGTGYVLFIIFQGASFTLPAFYVVPSQSPLLYQHLYCRNLTACMHSQVTVISEVHEQSCLVPTNRLLLADQQFSPFNETMTTGKGAVVAFFTCK